jgi:hypothetical protein
MEYTHKFFIHNISETEIPHLRFIKKTYRSNETLPFESSSTILESDVEKITQRYGIIKPGEILSLNENIFENYEYKDPDLKPQSRVRIKTGYYSPLPDYLTIRHSEIHGLGLYAIKKIEAGSILGITHIKDERFQNGYSRTPLGGFFNHSETPNCKVIYEGDFIYLASLQEIESGQELTVTYTFYDPTKTSNSFLEAIKKECDDNGVQYLFPETEKMSYPDSDIKVSGYFSDSPTPVLACAIGKPEDKWYEILVHESCHMDQWKEKSDIWLSQFADGINCDKGLDDWLAGKEFHLDEYHYYVRTIQAVEIDCEKRAVEKIKKYNLPINIERYIKSANSYLFFYSVMLETRKWCDIAPYEVSEIMELMPDYFLNEDKYKELSNELLQIYKAKCYK